MELSDANLVAESLTGNREAFAQIVARYQTLVCSLAYSGTGDMSQSEDLAQETFVAAWKQLGNLREPHKLRSWLCRIARNLACDALSKQGREPSHQAETLEGISESHSPEPLPTEQAISNEELAILWRSLERIPVIYREPLILFYREHQSIEAVAESLELSEDAVKQRLSRGRRLLHEQVLAFVEGALEQTNPGRVFTLSVLAALPALTISAKAATLGAVAAKGSAAAKTAGALGLFGALLNPAIAFSGLYANYRMSLDEVDSDEERRLIKSVFGKSLGITLILSAMLAAPLFWMCRNSHDSSLFWSLLVNQSIVVYFLTILAFVIGTLRARRRHLAGILTSQYAGKFPPSAYEYRSRLSLFGLPLIHVRIGDRFDVLRGPVKAWIAIGSSHAIGVLFAAAGIAIAPVSFGGVAIGFLSFGALGLGMCSLGAFSLGIWAYGGLAIGWQAFGGCAIAWNAAMGGVVVAHDFALGGIAHAAQANNEIAREYIQPTQRNVEPFLFFRYAQILSKHGMWLMLGWVLPLAVQSLITGRARRLREKGNQRYATQ